MESAGIEVAAAKLGMNRNQVGRSSRSSSSSTISMRGVRQGGKGRVKWTTDKVHVPTQVRGKLDKVESAGTEVAAAKPGINKNQVGRSSSCSS